MGIDKSVRGLRLWQQMQEFPIEGSNHPIDGYGFARLLEPGDLRPAHACTAPLQLNEPKVERVSVLFTDAKNDRVNNAGTGRSGSTLKEGDTPLLRLAIRPQSFLAGGFCGAGLRKCAHVLSGPN